MSREKERVSVVEEKRQFDPPEAWRNRAHIRSQMVDVLSKTLSGKIMRRILRKIAAGEVQDLGDTSVLANPSVVEELIKGRQ